MLAPLTGSDSETYLNVVQAVVNEHQDESFYSVRTIQGPLRDRDIYASPAQSLAHSACLIALRQEIWSVLLYRRPIRLPLCPNNEYLNLSPADDFVWTNRIILWCADVLKYCFGAETNYPSNNTSYMTGIERWDSLKAFEESWDTMQPACFKPLYYQESDVANGKYFPEIWHMNDCQVIGLQHIELGRMLLAVYNPRFQRVGIGANVHKLNLESLLRRSTVKLCGLAISKKQFQAAMVTAAVGISLFGEYFHDDGEQKAIIDFMETLEYLHAWPTETVVSALKEAWGYQSKTPGSMMMSTPCSL